MLPEARWRIILRTVKNEGPKTIDELALLVKASSATVRRDLHKLESQGLLQRTPGGGAAAVETDLPDTTFEEVLDQNVEAKVKIAAFAAAQVNDGETIVIDASTTGFYLAQALYGRSITVVTNSCPIVEALHGSAATEVIVLGGLVRDSYRSAVGFLTEEVMRQIRADKLFLSAGGVAAGVCLDTMALQVPAKQAMIKSSRKVTLIADGSKFPGVGASRVCGPEELDQVIVTDGIDDASLAAFDRAGVEVHVLK